MRKPKILLVDDADDAGALAERLADDGYEVVVRAVAIGTGAAIVRERPELVLWDVTMPLVTDGDVSALRTDPRVPETSLVIYARRDPTELATLVERCGADGYVQKADDTDEVYRRIRPWLPRGRRRKIRSGTELRARYVVVAGEPATHRMLLELLGEDAVARHTDAGLEALRWMGSADPPDLVLAGTSLTDLPALALARRALLLDPRWRQRLVIVDETPRGEAPIDGDVPQRIWRRVEPLGGLAAILHALRAAG